MSEQKKISFGFSKLTKKTILFNKPVAEEKKIQLIDCLEGQSIKIKDAIEEEVKPLVIPIKDNGKNLLDRVREANELKERSQAKIIAEVKLDDRPDSELTLDELAARQLIKEAQKLEAKPNAVKVHTLPAIEDKLILEGSVEPTMEDYENVPIGDYGMAMLRGMGWSEDKGIGKNKKSSLVAPPELRPKGMGLGASVMINKGRRVEKTVDKNGRELNLVKGAFAKIIAGHEKGNYCVVQGLDDEGGRIIVKTSLKGDVLTLNEFLLIPVTSEEYSKYSKVLNNEKYDQFKNKEKNEESVKNGNVKVEEEERKLGKYERKREDSTSSVEILRSKNDEIVDLTESHSRRKKDKLKNRSRSRSKENVKYRSRESTRSRSRSRDNYKSKRDSRRTEKEVSSRRNYSESRSRSRERSSRGSRERKYKDVSPINKKDKCYRDSSSDRSVSRERIKSSKSKNKSKKSKKHREGRRSSSGDRRKKEKKNKKSKSRRESSSSSDDYDERNRRSRR